MRSGLAFALMLACAYMAAASSEDVPGIAIGAAAPELKGTWVTANGAAPDTKGKVVLIDFWFIH